jgi:uncharacterized membrane protein YcaP (DUF421 family)
VALGVIVGSTATASGTAFLAGVVALATILLMHHFVTRLRRNRSLAALVDQPIRLLMAEGRMRREELRKAGLSEQDVYAMLRQRGVSGLARVRYLIYEAKGAVSVVGWDQAADREPLADALRIAPVTRDR